MLQNLYISTVKQCFPPSIDTHPTYMEYPPYFYRAILISPSMIFQKTQFLINKGVECLIYRTPNSLCTCVGPYKYHRSQLLGRPAAHFVLLLFCCSQVKEKVFYWLQSQVKEKGFYWLQCLKQRDWLRELFYYQVQTVLVPQK